MGGYGAGFLAQGMAYFTLRDMGFGAGPYITSIPAEINGDWFTISQSAFVPDLPFNCTMNCGQTSYPYGLRLTGYNGSSGNCTDQCAIHDSIIHGGLMIDPNGFSGEEGGIKISDTVFEEPVGPAVMVDPRYSSPVLPITMDDVYLQDNFNGFSPMYFGFTDVSTLGSVRILAESTIDSNGVTVNSNYQGQLSINGFDNWQGILKLPIGRAAPVGTIANGGMIQAELDGIDAAMGPSLIPYATASVTTSPASWTCGGGCTVLTGIQAPDGTTNAGEVDSGSGGTAQVTVYNYNGATTAGDWIIYGSWVRAGTNNPAGGSQYGGPFGIYDPSTDVLSANLNTTAFSLNISGNWWHPVVIATQVLTGDATSHTIAFHLYGSGNGAGNQFYMPFFLYIPASANVSSDEVERWRQQLMHGVVPPGMPGGGALLAMNLTHKMYWGSDTNLYRGAAGVVQTDGKFNAVNGYQQNGSALNFSNLAGSVSAAQLIAPTTSALGAVESKDCSISGASYFVQKINTDGTETCATLTGAGTGNVTGPSTSTVNDLATFNATNGQIIQDSGVLVSAVRTTAGGATITAADTVSGLPSGCTQFPCVVAKVAPTTIAVSSSQSYATFYTTPSGSQHVYSVCMSEQVTTTGSAGAYEVQVIATANSASFIVTTAPATVTSTSNNASGCYSVVADASTNIQGKVYVSTSISGSPALQYAITLSMLQ